MDEYLSDAEKNLVLRESVLDHVSTLADEAGSFRSQGLLLQMSMQVERIVSAAAAFHRAGETDLARSIHDRAWDTLPEEPALQTLHAHLEGSAPKAVCKICGRQADFFGCADMGKTCGSEEDQFMPRACTYLAYHQCPFCGFLFTPDLDGWTPEMFENRIYNDDYLKVDGDFLEVRPRQAAGSLASRLGSWGSRLEILDYGGGRGALEAELRKRGYASVATYDPFFHARKDFPDHASDLILSIEVFEHVPSPHHLMSDLLSLLRRDGLIFFTTLLQPDNLAEQGISWWYLAPRNGHISP